MIGRTEPVHLKCSEGLVKVSNWASVNRDAMRDFQCVKGFGELNRHA